MVGAFLLSTISPLQAAPEIVTQPTNQTVVAGQDAILTVGVSGSLSVSFQWRNGTNDIPDATNATLMLPQVQSSQAGSYSVLVSDETGVTNSAVAILTVQVPPGITGEPADRTVNQGQSTSLTVAVNGTSPFRFAWWFANAPLAGATNAMLNLSPAQGNQSGSYWVVVNNMAGAATSRVATVLVVVPPVIVTQPVALSVLPGATATFTVVATGTAPTFQWKFNGSPIAGATNSVLTLSGVTASQAGAYKVDVNNAAATVTSSQVNLTVYQAPVITTQPLDRVLNQGQTTNLSVTATADPTPSFQWWFNGQRLAGATSATLTLASAQGNQSGSYSVVLSNIAGTVTSRVATVLVVVPPVIVTQPVAQSVLPGATATFTVVATGTAPTFQWKFNGSPIADATNSVLTLSGVTASQAGAYKVDVNNAAAAVTSSQVNLTVYQAPVITAQPADRVLNQGQTTNLTVSATGIPNPAFQWWFNNQPLAGATSATLTLASAQGNQSGSYSVVLSNIAGTVTSRVATVLVVVPPVIVTQPVAQSVLPGATVTFTVVATGTAPIFQWKFNGAPIANATNSVLTLSGVTASQAGGYKVDVNNAAAAVTSSEVNLTVYQAPIITTQPADCVLNQGQTTNLTITATGLPNPSYQWWFNNQPLTGAISATLTLASAQGNQSGAYSVVLSNIAGSVTSRVATVLVIVPPAMVTQPVSQSVFPGTTVTFTVVASGTAPTFQWTFNGSPIAGATNSALTLSAVTAAQAGAYKVDVMNAAGNVTSKTADLTVYQAPLITVQPPDRVLNQGQTTNLSVTANGIPSPSYQWRFNGQPLAGATSATLTLTSAQGSQSGSYSVIVSNLAGSVTSRVATVLVIVPPVIVQQPVGQSVLPGTQVTFAVVATGTAPTYQWKFNGTAMSGATNATLVLANVQAAQSGSYKVDVANAAASVTSSQVTLTVYQPPVITSQPADRVLNLGQNGSLNVTASGIPAPSYRWWFTNAPLPGATNATLSFVAVQTNQEGSYWLVASNIAGVATSRVASVKVIVPPAITQQPVDQAVDRGEDVTFRVVASGTAPRYQWTWNGVGMANETNATLQLSKVIPSQAGTYSVIVSNAAGRVTSVAASLIVRRLDVYWTQSGSGFWDKPGNWSHGLVPDGWDNVYIVSNGTYTVTVNGNASAGSLHLGTAIGVQTLSLTAGVFDISTNGVGSSLVSDNGLVDLNGGILAGRPLTLGRMAWIKGEVRSLVRIQADGWLDLSGTSPKILSTGIIDNSGTTVWAGTGDIQFGKGSAVTNSGLFEIQSNGALTSTNVPAPWFVNVGTLRKTTAIELTVFGGVELRNRGTMDLQSGGVSLTSGQHSLTTGSRITGPGSLSVNGGQVSLAGAISTESPLDLNSGSLNGSWTLAGLLNWRGGTMADGGVINGTLNLMGGIVANDLTVNGPVNLSAGDISSGKFAVNGDLNWTGGRISTTRLALDGNVTWANGVLSGRLIIPNNRSLTLTGAGTRQIDGGTLTNRSSLVIPSPVTISCDNGAVIYNFGSIQLGHDAPFTGGAGSASRFFNYGTVTKAGTGQLNWNTLELHNLGSFDLTAGILALGTKLHSFDNNSTITGPGRLWMTNGSLAIGTNVTCEPVLEMQGGTATGSGTFLGNVDWSGGTLAGVLTLGPTRQLHLMGTGTKTFAKDFILNIGGATTVDGAGAVLFYANATINNTGDLEIRSSGNFTFNASDRAVLNNFGTLHKTVSTAVLPFGALQLVNRGIVDIQTGSINFTAFTHSLENGSSLSGPGGAVINGGTLNLNGTVTSATALTMTSGTLAGTGTLQGDFIWSGGTLSGTQTMKGSTTWSAGTLSGQLNVAASGDMTVSSTTVKTISGLLNNDGRVVVLDRAPLTLSGLTPIVNGGNFEIQTDKPFIATAVKPVFQNNGTLLKTTSKFVTDFGAVILRNSGTLDLQSGDVTFSVNSHSFTDGAHTTGPGTVRVAGGTLTVTGTARLDAPFVLASGTLAGNGTLVGNITVMGGFVTGTFVLNGDASWSGGEISGSLTAAGGTDWSSGLLSGTLSIPASGRLNVLTPGTNSISGTLQNAGTVVVSNTATLRLMGGTPIINTGVFEVQNETPFKPNGSVKVTFINDGTFRKTTSVKPMDFTFVLLQNSGTIDMRAGEIYFRTNTHSLKDGSRTTGSGTLHVSGATLNVAGAVALGVPLSLELGYLGGTATLNGSFAFAGGQVTGDVDVNGSSTWAGGILKGSLTVIGAGSWTAGQLEGSLHVATNGALAISSTSLKFIKGGAFTNLGMVTLMPLSTMVGDGLAFIQNAGAFVVPGTASLLMTNGRPVFNNYGALSLTNGFGSFTLQADYRQYASGYLDLELGGRDAGTNFNRLIGVNSATLAGGLKVRVVNGFLPQKGDRLAVMKFASRTGTFGSYTANTPALSPDYSTTNVTLFADAPSITSQPQGMTVSDGATVNFSVGTYGSVPMTYRWFLNGTALDGTNAALTVTNVQPVHEGFYTVLVSNMWGSITSVPASLIVIVQPGIIRQPDSLTVVEGDEAALTVVASGTHLTYQWISDRDPLIGATNATLLFTNVMAANAGTYHVEMRNRDGFVASREVVLTVLVPPTITQQPASVDVASGEWVSLSVRVSGTSPFSYQWLKDGVALTGGNQSSYSISRMALAQEGSYVVIVANAAGYTYSLPAVLRVRRAPQFTTQPLSQSAVRGSNVIFSVAVTGVPNPTVQWQLNGINLPGATKTTLLLTNVQPKDSGRYGVVAVNALGTVRSLDANLQVIVPGLPFADMFANRGIIYSVSGSGRGTNCGATIEAVEPRLARNSSAKTQVGSTVWLSWWSPANGIATFSTLGSEFDTVMGVFKGTSLNALTQIAVDDDSAGFHCSKVSFNAQAGVYYEIAIGGLGDACGGIMLNWNLIQTTELLPEIVEAPLDRTGNTNDSIVLKAVFNVFEPTAIQWFYQGQIITNATLATLTIPSLQEKHVGGYSVRLLGNSGRAVVSAPGDLQINTEGVTGASARNKFFDGFERALTP